MEAGAADPSRFAKTAAPAKENEIVSDVRCVPREEHETVSGAFRMPRALISRPRGLDFTTLGAQRAFQRGLAGGEKRPHGPEAVLGLRRARPRRSLDDFGPEKNCLRAALRAPGESPCFFSYGIYKGFAHFSKRRLREHFRQDFGEAEKHQKTTLSKTHKIRNTSQAKTINFTSLCSKFR